MPNRLAISSMSLGRCYAGHGLEHRLDLAQKYGYEGIELFYEDLADLASQLPYTPPASPSARDHGKDGKLNTEADRDAARQVAAASAIRSMCAARGLAVVSLQPFSNYDGLLDRALHTARLAELRHWIDLAHALGTDLVQIPSSMLPASQTTASLDVLVADLAEAADLAAAADPPLRVAYESLAWSSTSDDWETSWEVVQRAGRANLGLCLDTFNIAARVYADPSLPSGRNPGCEEALRLSVSRLVRAVDPAKVFFVQVVDAERLADGPLVPGHRFHVEGQPARMSWSRNCRLFYGEEDRGAYLPVRQIASAIFRGLGYEGWVSLELFNRRMADEGDEVPEELAMRGAESWRRLVQDLGLPVKTGGSVASASP